MATSPFDRVLKSATSRWRIASGLRTMPPEVMLAA
jgi:hypothetical protein